MLLPQRWQGALWPPVGFGGTNEVCSQMVFHVAVYTYMSTLNSIFTSNSPHQWSHIIRPVFQSHQTGLTVYKWSVWSVRRPRMSVCCTISLWRAQCYIICDQTTHLQLYLLSALDVTQVINYPRPFLHFCTASDKSLVESWEWVVCITLLHFQSCPLGTWVKRKSKFIS